MAAVKHRAMGKVKHPDDVARSGREMRLVRWRCPVCGNEVGAPSSAVVHCHRHASRGRGATLMVPDTEAADSPAD